MRSYKNDDDDDDNVNKIAELMGVPFKVQISAELKDLLKPNEFMADLGIQYFERIKNVLGALKENLIPINQDLEEKMPQEGVTIPLAMATGPFIKEELISIRAELTDGDGEAAILLTVIHRAS